MTKSVDATGIETAVTAMSMGAKIVYRVFGIAGVRIVVANLFGSKKA